jgi:hypothetical protein
MRRKNDCRCSGQTRTKGERRLSWRTVNVGTSDNRTSRDRTDSGGTSFAPPPPTSSTVFRVTCRQLTASSGAVLALHEASGRITRAQEKSSSAAMVIRSTCDGLRARTLNTSASATGRFKVPFNSIHCGTYSAAFAFGLPLDASAV